MHILPVSISEPSLCNLGGGASGHVQPLETEIQMTHMQIFITLSLSRFHLLFTILRSDVFGFYSCSFKLLVRDVVGRYFSSSACHRTRFHMVDIEALFWIRNTLPLIGSWPWFGLVQSVVAACCLCIRKLYVNNFGHAHIFFNSGCVFV